MTTYASLVLRSEEYGVRPDFEHPRRSRRRAIKSPKGSPRRVRRTVNEREVRSWTLSWDDAPEGVVSHLIELWADAAGPVLPMAYTPVGKTDADALDVRFVDDSLVIEHTRHGAFRIRVAIEEVL